MSNRIEDSTNSQNGDDDDGGIVVYLNERGAQMITILVSSMDPIVRVLLQVIQAQLMIMMQYSKSPLMIYGKR